MSSLGFRARNDHIAEPYKPRSASTAVSVSTIKEEPEPRKRWRLACKYGVARGALPIFLLSTLSLLVPIFHFYVDYDETTDVAKGMTIGLSAGTVIALILANDCCCWFNMILFFHIGLEVKVIDTALTFAYGDSVPSEQMALAVLGGVVVIAHLIPFLVMDRPLFLTLFAGAGVVVNTSILTFLDASLTLVVFASSSFLLVMVMVLSGICEVRTSILGTLRTACDKRQLVTCDSFEL